MESAVHKFLSVLLAFTLVMTLLPGMSLTAGATDDAALSVVLGDAAATGSTYYYSNAAVTGSDIKTVLLSFSESVASGDRIILPENAPPGFTVSDTSANNDHTKRINIDTAAAGTDDAAAVQTYIRGRGKRRILCPTGHSDQSGSCRNSGTVY